MYTRQDFGRGKRANAWKGPRLKSMLKNSARIGFVSGHDFSRAAKGRRMNVGFSPCAMLTGRKASNSDFFRKL
jgi:hypothetical protein